VITFLLIEKVGRRTLTVPTQWLCAVVLGIIGLWTGAPAPIVLILFLVFSFFNAGYNTLTNVYPGEVPPTEIRGIGTGFAAAISRVGAGIGIFLFPMSMESLGAGPTMLIAAGVALLGAGLSQRLAPETKGKALHAHTSAAACRRGRLLIVRSFSSPASLMQPAYSLLQISMEPTAPQFPAVRVSNFT
jgi:putative MFS transporter